MARRAMQKSVVVGVDGSPESLHAAVIGSRIARAASNPCVLVHAVPHVWAPAGLTALLNTTEVALAAAGVGEPLVGLTGKPGVVLDQLARERGAGLIVVGGRHHGALSRGLGGSTAHHLVRTANAPVLVVDSGTEKIDRVLVAADLLHAGVRTLSAAAHYAALLGARLRAVHVVEPAKCPTVVPLSLDLDEFERRCRVDFERLIESELPDLPRDDRVVRRGLADEEIVEEAATWRADLLVVGSHGKGWIDRMLIGSTTERLLNRLPTSLLVVPIDRPASSSDARTRRTRRRNAAVPRM